MIFKRGPKTPNGANGKPSTGAQPKGGYGSGRTPHKAQKTSAPRGDQLRMKSAANKPKGGYGARGAPKPKASKVDQKMGEYAADGMSWPDATLDKLKKRKLFNMPKGKFTGGL